MDFHNAFSFAKGAVASSSHDNSGAIFPWEKGLFAATFSNDNADPLNQVSSSEVSFPSLVAFSVWELQSSFTAALAMKSTNTLVKRSLDLKRCSDWCASQDIPILPFQERSIFKYLSTLALTSASSGPLSVLQAIAFSIHVLSCRVAFPHATNFPSQRIKGLCYSHRASGDVVNHAKPLSVAQICHLETLCATAADPYQTLVFGN